MSARQPTYCAGLLTSPRQIWHTDLKDWRRVTLPGPLTRCYVQGERVAFFTRQGLLVAWSWRGGASEIDISGEMNQPPEGYCGPRSFPGVILHPEKPDTLYVASMFRSKFSKSPPSPPNFVFCTLTPTPPPRSRQNWAISETPLFDVGGSLRRR